MKTRFGIFFAVAMLGGCDSSTVPAQPSATPQPTESTTPMKDPVPNKTITRHQLDAMFANIAKKTDWDMSKPMLWGYFFTDGTRGPLEKARLHLEEQGYRYVDIFIADKEEPNEDDVWLLHVEKEEVHSAATLDKRNDELYRFAHKHGLGAYDGMDVGPIQKETAN